MTPWGAIHVGDTVQGADGRVWTVVEATEGLSWIGSGVTDITFHLRDGTGRTVTARRNTRDPAPLVARADHTEWAAACTAFLNAGLTFDILGETMTTAIADPFTAPKAPVKRNRWGQYLLPDPVTGKEKGWVRVTTVARTLSDEYNLTQWKLRMACKGIALRPDLIAGAAAADPAVDKDTLDSIAGKAMESAGSSSGSTLGTAVHTFAQRIDGGEELGAMGAPPSIAADLAEYTDTLRRHGLTVYPGYMERIVVIPELGVAGTLDRLVGQPTGPTHSLPLAVLDLKTGKDLSYGWLDIAIQEALYAHASLMWDPDTETYVEMPPVDQHRGLVLHLPVGRAKGQLYGVNLVEGWKAVQLAMNVRETRSGAKTFAWLVDPDPAALALHNVSRAATREDLAQWWEVYHPRGLWTAEVAAAANARMTQLSNQPTSIAA